MKKIATWTVLAFATSLAGCTGAAYSNRSLESVHQPVVRNSIYQFDVAASNGELPPSEQGRLQGWFDAMGVRYGDRVAIEDGSAYGAGSAQATVRSMVERRGMLLSTDVPVTTGAVPQGYLRVIVTRATASVPGCPNWESKSSFNPVNATSSNYGCAVNGNLASIEVMRVVPPRGSSVRQCSRSPSDADTSTLPVARIFSSRAGHWLTSALTSSGASAANVSGVK